jgi:hypothetical protein
VFLAPAKTLAELLSKHNATHIDMMVLDLEGAELPALRGMDFDRCNVSAILIEARDVAAVDAFLSPRGSAARLGLRITIISIALDLTPGTSLRLVPQSGDHESDTWSKFSGGGEDGHPR